MTEENPEESPQGFDKAEEEWIKEQRARENQRKSRSKDSQGGGEAETNINSLMDIMVILLVFLLESFGNQPVKITGQDLRVPKSTTDLPAKDMTTVTVTRKSILVDDEQVAEVPVDDSKKRGGESGLEIIPMLERLNTVIEQKKQEMKLMGKEFEPVLTVVADESTPYRLLTEVMYTAGQAGLSKFKFAVVKGSKDTMGPTG